MTIINPQCNLLSTDHANFFQTLNNPQRGREYLITALESQNEQIFLATLHNLMDAILWDLESGKSNIAKNSSDHVSFQLKELSS